MPAIATPAPDYTAQRFNMVESQVRANDVTDVRIQEAMREVPRERFVPPARRALAYADAAVEVAPGRFLLEPRTFAKLAQLARIAPTDRVLDVGCSTGYSTAVLSRLCREVVGLEEDAALACAAAEMTPSMGANARIVQGRLADGHPAGAPYDMIVIEGAVEFVPDSLQDRLAEGGRLVAVVQNGPQGLAHLFVREHGRTGSRPAFDANAPPLPGFQASNGFVF